MERSRCELACQKELVVANFSVVQTKMSQLNPAPPCIAWWVL